MEADEEHIEAEGRASPLEGGKHPVVEGVESHLDAAHADNSGSVPRVGEDLAQDTDNWRFVPACQFVLVCLLVVVVSDNIASIHYFLFVGPVDLSDSAQVELAVVHIFATDEVEGGALQQQEVGGEKEDEEWYQIQPKQIEMPVWHVVFDQPESKLCNSPNRTVNHYRSLSHLTGNHVSRHHVW